MSFKISNMQYNWLWVCARAMTFYGVLGIFLLLPFFS